MLDNCDISSFYSRYHHHRISIVFFNIILVNMIIISIHSFHAYDINKLNKLRLLYDDYQSTTTDNDTNTDTMIIMRTNSSNDDNQTLPITTTTITTSVVLNDNLNNNSNNNSSSRCQSYHNATRIFSHDFIKELSLWPNLMSHSDKVYGESLYGSRQGSRYILYIWVLNLLYEKKWKV